VALGAAVVFFGGQPRRTPASAVAKLPLLPAADAVTTPAQRDEPERGPESLRGPVPEGAPSAGVAGAGSPGTTRAEQLKAKLADAQREKRDVEAQLQMLEAELEREASLPRMAQPREFELSAEDWKALAAEGRIKYRIPCELAPQAHYGNMRNALDELGLSSEEGEVLTDLHRRSNARVWATLRPLCIELVGRAEVVDLLGRSSCLSLIERVATQKDPKAAMASRRRVAEVHAGIAQPPTAKEPPDPLATALLAVTGEARRFEADLAESFGPEEAKRISDSMTCVATAR
jgi:hypothetical protein